MIKHIIFDCFGTLIDTGSGSLGAVKQILQSVNSDADAAVFYRDWKRIKKDMMDSGDFESEKTLFAISLAKVFDKYGIKADAQAEVKPMTDSLFGDRRAFDDVRDTLKALDENGIEYAIGSTTDTDSLAHFLSLNALEFDRVFTSEDMRAYKPHKAFYETILDRTGWRAEDCLFVGDSYVDDVVGPKSVGMRAALLDRKGKHKAGSDIEPDYVLSSLSELEDIIEAK